MVRLMPDLPRSGQHADLILNGGLADLIRGWRSENPQRGWDWIARQLKAIDPRIDVSGVTVRGWDERLSPAVTADEGAA